jgi:hypothetical protein
MTRKPTNMGGDQDEVALHDPKDLDRSAVFMAALAAGVEVEVALAVINVAAPSLRRAVYLREGMEMRRRADDVQPASAQAAGALRVVANNFIRLGNDAVDYGNRDEVV